jgi:hypothetical protein
VTVSGAHFFGIGHEGMADQIQRNGASTRSNDAFFEVTGSWLENVAGWMNEGTHPLLLVKYENLCARPINELRRVLKFLGRPVLHKQLHRAVRHTSFEGRPSSATVNPINGGRRCRSISCCASTRNSGP